MKMLIYLFGVVSDKFKKWYYYKTKKWLWSVIKFIILIKEEPYNNKKVEVLTLKQLKKLYNFLNKKL